MAFTTSLFLVEKRGKFLAVGTRQVDEIGGQKNDYQGSRLLGCKLRTAAVVGPPAGDFDGSPTPNARATAGAIFIRGQSRTVYSIRLKKKQNEIFNDRMLSGSSSFLQDIVGDCFLPLISRIAMLDKVQPVNKNALVI